MRGFAGLPREGRDAGQVEDGRRMRDDRSSGKLSSREGDVKKRDRHLWMGLMEKDRPLREQMIREPPPYDLFQWMSDPSRKAFLDACRTRRYRRGDILFSEGDPGREMFRILRGRVRLSASQAGGTEVIYSLYDHDEVFGDSSCIDGRPRSQTAEAASDLVVHVLDKKAFDDLCAEHREFEYALLQLLNRQVRLFGEFMKACLLGDLRNRVVSRLAAISQEAAGDQSLSVRLSQSELAMMVGASRQAVNKVLQKLQREGVIRIEYGKLVILSLGDLTENLVISS